MMTTTTFCERTYRVNVDRSSVHLCHYPPDDFVAKKEKSRVCGKCRRGLFSSICLFRTNSKFHFRTRDLFSPGPLFLYSVLCISRKFH
ncbi:Hypothetical protein, putative [Bodo saltans]|uniref:Uncharacterized protein n=1 Tax=Bodo saltans TaxID=75058 RepID=A0A0S4JDD9_BODSA|nr:Hypothetical protein, putative [Bodo saltans]|eukprot:CUG88106.1 Hypothetical protein, putative [Bodo saltans]